MSEPTRRLRNAVSIRAKLTFWYTALLALILVVFALVVYGALAKFAAQSSESSLDETAEDFIDAFRAEARLLPNRDVREVADNAAQDFRYKDRTIEVYTLDHTLVASSDVPASAGAPHETRTPPATLQRIMTGLKSNSLARAAEGSGRFGRRYLGVPATVNGQNFIVVVSRSLGGDTDVLGQMRESFILGIPLALLVAALSGYLLARTSLRPVMRMSEQAATIGATNLHSRIAIENEKDELGRLAAVLNSLFERLDLSFRQQRRLMADASHELRTPVAIVRGETEVALSREERTSEEYRETLTIVHEEAKRMSNIVDSLFTMARADAGQLSLVPSDFFLEELASDCVRAVRTIASKKSITTTFEGDEELPIRADEALLRRMVLNLLDNALKYTPDGGRVIVRAETNGGGYRITVTDTGTGIPTDAQPFIFDPFFRADTSRHRNDTSTGSGAGLGLPIARWIAEAHGGTLELQHSDERGSIFVASLPREITATRVPGPSRIASAERALSA